MVASLSCAELGTNLSPRLFLFFSFNSSLDILINYVIIKKKENKRLFSHNTVKERIRSRQSRSEMAAQDLRKPAGQNSRSGVKN